MQHLMIGEIWIEEDLEGIGCGLIEVGPRHLPRGTDKKQENLSQGNPCPDRYSNWRFSEHKSKLLPLH
jgi:hypothetical protein